MGRAWSIEKKHWCCDHQDKGCSTTTSLPFDCAAGLSNWQDGWSSAKKDWCCAHTNKGCVVYTHVVTKPYECSAGLANWEAGWSPGKKIWCCAKENLGCTTSLPYDCNAACPTGRLGGPEARRSGAASTGAWDAQHPYLTIAMLAIQIGN